LPIDEIIAKAFPEGYHENHYLFDGTNLVIKDQTSKEQVVQKIKAFAKALKLKTLGESTIAAIVKKN